MSTAVLTLEQKKSKVDCLSREFLSSPDVSRLTHLKNDIVEEIISCGFCEDMTAITNIIIPMWDETLDSYILAVRVNAVNIEIKRLAEVALLGLSHLMDLSGFA
jgi:hypothetical protein